MIEFFGSDSLLDLIRAIGLWGIIGIIFAETGLFVGFFLPGDSLLVTAGVLASQGYLQLTLLAPLTFIAAIAGNLVGYAFGARVGPKLFSKEDSLFFHKKHLERSKQFFERHGGKTVILSRFVPIIRTFTPILAGIGSMPHDRFVRHTVIGAALWTFPLILLGYGLGKAIGDVDRYILPIVVVIIIGSFLPALFHRNNKPR